jgi:hypothetical protein
MWVVLITHESIVTVALESTSSLVSGSHFLTKFFLE